MSFFKAAVLFSLFPTVIVLFFVGVQAESKWVPINDDRDKSEPAIRVINSDEFETSIEFNLPGFSVESSISGSETFHHLGLPDYSTTLEVGKPQLPVISELVAVPGDARVTVSVIDSIIVKLDGYNVFPFQTPLLEGQIRAAFDIDRDFYSGSELYPEVAAEVGEPAVWRDVRVVSLKYYPIRYNPATDELLIYSRVVVKLEYEGKSDRNIFDYSNRVVSSRYDRLYREKVLNYDFLNLPVGEKSKADYDLLIITMTKFYQTMLTFHDFKESWCGIETHLQDFFDLNVSSPEDLKDYIQDEYNNNNIDFVILVGDISDIPIYGDYTYDNGKSMISDYYYTLLAGDDLYPEISIGRFSVEYDIEAYNMESKTRHFLIKDPNENEWLNQVLLVAHAEEAPEKYQMCKEEIRNEVYAHPPVFDVCYGGEGGTTEDVINRFRDGRGVVNYRGHGSETEWWEWDALDNSLNKNHVETLDNDSITPIVFGIACWNNKLDRSSWCLGEQFTLNEDGAVTYLGASRPSWTGANHTYDKKIFDVMFNNEGGYLGDAIKQASITTINRHGVGGEENVKMYILLGDPSITFPPIIDPDTTYVGVVIDTSKAMQGKTTRAVDYLIDIINDILKIPNKLIALLPSPENPEVPWPRVPPTPNPNTLAETLDSLRNSIYIDTSYLNDAMCAAADFINDQADTSTKRIIIATAGGKYMSGNECSGTNDPSPPWDDDPGSWQYKVWHKIMDNNIILDVAYFGEGNAKDRDDQGQFLRDLALASGGGWYNPADTAICGNGLVEIGEDCEDQDDCGMTDDGRALGFCNELCRCACDCIPGDANGSWDYNILDVTYLINFLYKGGPPPQPYGECSGDPNCDCAINILDVVHLINYMYKFGIPPCECETWLSNCGST